jgi:hypothetical protein
MQIGRRKRKSGQQAVTSEGDAHKCKLHRNVRWQVVWQRAGLEQAWGWPGAGLGQAWSRPGAGRFTDMSLQ